MMCSLPSYCFATNACLLSLHSVPCRGPAPTPTVQGGDAVWEGIRVYQGRVFHLEEHLQRLHDSARAMAFQDIPSKAFIKVLS